MAAAYSAAHRGDAVLVWEAGTLVLERYQNGYDADAPHMLASGTKTFAGVMALAAAADGFFALDDLVGQHLPAWPENGPKAQITIRQLLHLTSGLDPGGLGDAPPFDTAVQAELLDAPGTRFQYGPTAFQVFGALLQHVLDGEDPVGYLKRRVLTPIGTAVGGWRYVDQRDPQLAGGARMTARDWLRFGRLLLSDGRWNGEPVLPAGLLDALTAPTPASPGYGLTVWLNAAVDTSHAFFEGAPPSVRPDGPNGMIYNDGPSDLFMAAGLFNQRLYVIPSEQMVVVRFGRADAAWSDAAFLARLLDGRAYDPPPRPRASMAERIALLTTLRMTQLDAALTLTDTQEQAIRPAVKGQIEELTMLEDGSDMSRRARRRALRRLRQVRQQTDRVILTELTDEQAEVYRDLRAEERKKRLERWRERR
jgi:CubicO group peptidase (beta-lactamase class C family)